MLGWLPLAQHLAHKLERVSLIIAIRHETGAAADPLDVAQSSIEGRRRKASIAAGGNNLF